MINLMKIRVVKQIIPTRTRHDEFREVLSNIELRIHLKVPFLISLTLFFNISTFKVDTNKIYS